jgi:hypothetical protein
MGEVISMRWKAATMLLSLSLPCLAAAQAVRQEEGKLLYAPNFIQANDNNGHMLVIGFSLASLPAIPLSATIESEVQSTDANGNPSSTRWITKAFRDVCGSLRMEIDANALGAARDERLINIQIYDATTKSEMSMTPWNKSAFLIQQEGDSAPPEFFGSPCLREPAQKPVRSPAKFDQNPKVSPQSAKHPTYMEPRNLGYVGQNLPQPDIRREELGVEVLEGMPLRHGRQTEKYPAGYFGHKDAYSVVLDYWYSQELQAFVLVKQLGPDNLVQTLTLRNIKRDNPASSLFTIPRNYTIHKVLMKAPETHYIL